MSRHKGIWTDKEWEALMEAQGRALRSKLGGEDERETEIQRIKRKENDGVIQEG